MSNNSITPEIQKLKKYKRRFDQDFTIKGPNSSKQQHMFCVKQDSKELNINRKKKKKRREKYGVVTPQPHPLQSPFES